MTAGSSPVIAQCCRSGIEFDRHDILFAEGMPAESFVDCDNRGMFHNAGEFASLYPGDRRPAWDFCAPRLEEASAELPAIRAALLQRAEALGHTLDSDPDLHLIVDGEIIRGRRLTLSVRHSGREPRNVAGLAQRGPR